MMLTSVIVHHEPSVMTAEIGLAVADQPPKRLEKMSDAYATDMVKAANVATLNRPNVRPVCGTSASRCFTGSFDRRAAYRTTTAMPSWNGISNIRSDGSGCSKIS